MSPVREKEFRADSYSKWGMSKHKQRCARSIRIPSLKLATEHLNCIATILSCKVTCVTIFRYLDEIEAKLMYTNLCPKLQKCKIIADFSFIVQTYSKQPDLIDIVPALSKQLVQMISTGLFYTE